MLSETLKLKGLNYAFLALLFGLKYLYVNLSLNIKLYYRSEKQTRKLKYINSLQYLRLYEFKITISIESQDHNK
uniref:Uncharacterized protein n=1 Tax=Glossina palpalis gambiensis TaxID=67801 RepID=A0A1B0BX27_9MUSC